MRLLVAIFEDVFICLNGLLSYVVDYGFLLPTLEVREFAPPMLESYSIEANVGLNEEEAP
jgi:hypothetical protein